MEQEQNLNPKDLRILVDNYTESAKTLRRKYDELMKEIKPMYEEMYRQQKSIFDLQDEVRKYGIVEGQLSIGFLKECLIEMRNVDKTPYYDSYIPDSKINKITESMKNKNGELPPGHSSWMTPSQIAQKLLNLIEDKSYNISFEQLYYKMDRN